MSRNENRLTDYWFYWHNLKRESRWQHVIRLSSTQEAVFARRGTGLNEWKQKLVYKARRWRRLFINRKKFSTYIHYSAAIFRTSNNTQHCSKYYKCHLISQRIGRLTGDLSYLDYQTKNHDGLWIYARQTTSQCHPFIQSLRRRRYPLTCVTSTSTSTSSAASSFIKSRAGLSWYFRREPIRPTTVTYRSILGPRDFDPGLEKPHGAHPWRQNHRML